MSSTASAPASAASHTCHAVDDEVLAQQREVDRGGHGAQVVERAAEAVGSVSTEIASAPAAS